MEIFPTKAYGSTGSVFNGLQPVTVERTPLDNPRVAMHRRDVAGQCGLAGGTEPVDPDPTGPHETGQPIPDPARRSLSVDPCHHASTSGSGARFGLANVTLQRHPLEERS